ncbi:outer membrane beta-barrel protein [Sphingobacterium corticibacterium]|uniref:PorT family protein n=1 Tax=Sphingobacterium corticibacterium TaxID=2484746 RepID=A0A4Q6XMD5_9SPHI|nr:PorT family protein [Sphingobacterium corticibacterium]RZF58404.1 PorT family protein [Sphingobacterium corticibacterium]
MKTNLLYTGLMSIAMLFSAQHAFTQEDDSNDTIARKINIEPTIGKKDYDDRGKEIKYPRVFGGLTFTRIDWGFSRLIDDGSFTLGEENQFLKYKKASNFGFDVAQFGVRFNETFKMYVSAGFEWNYLRLKNDIILDTEATPLTYSPSDITYKKNIFTSTYLRTPLSFEWRGRRNHQGHRPKIAFGAMTGVLLKGTQRFKSEEHGKQKFKDNYNLASFQYGAFARVGFGSLGLFAKYYMNDIFENSPNQENLNNFTFGLTLGF